MSETGAGDGLLGDRRLSPWPAEAARAEGTTRLWSAAEKADAEQRQSVLARVAGLKTASIADLKAQWRDLFGKEPPAFNRRYLESRLAYRIQELAFGGLKPETVRRLVALGEAIASGRAGRKPSDRPVSGTRLLREWQGVVHCVTVLADGYEYQGRPFQSLSAVARAITGTRWNGWTFFGLKRQRGRS